MLYLGSLRKVSYCVYFDVFLYRDYQQLTYIAINSSNKEYSYVSFQSFLYNVMKQYCAFLSSKATVVYIRCNKVK